MRDANLGLWMETMPFLRNFHLAHAGNLQPQRMVVERAAVDEQPASSDHLVDGPFVKVASRSYFICMRAVGLKTLKNKLSEYVRLVASGETVLVTDRDRVVAELTPPRPGRSEQVADAMLAEAMRRGWVTPPAAVGAGAPPRKPVMAYRDLMEELHRDRDDR